jgi:ATP-dependent Zn protease
MSRQRAAAYHEASHTVVAGVVGVKVLHVEVRPDGSGVTKLMPPRRDDSEAVWLDRATISFAGMCGEDRAFGGSWVGRGDGSNVASAVLRVVRLRGIRGATAVGAELDALVGECGRRSAAIVEQHWPAVVRVADALVRHGRVSGADIDTLMHT